MLRSNWNIKTTFQITLQVEEINDINYVNKYLLWLYICLNDRGEYQKMHIFL